MFTGRDAVHAHLMKHEPPVDLRGGVLYHCGPVVAKDGDGVATVTAAGPTTSIREEPYQADIIEALRRARRDRQGRHGREDARRPEGVRRRLPERDRRRGAVLRPLHRARRRRVADGVRHARSDVAPRRHATSRRSSRWTRTATACTRTIEEASGRACSATLPQERPGSAGTGRAASSSHRFVEQLARVAAAAIGAVVEVEPHGPPVVGFERLGSRRAPARASAPQNESRASGIGVSVSSSAVSTNATHGVRSALVILPGRVQVARADAEGARDAWSARGSRRGSPRPRIRSSASAGRYERNAT